MSLSLVLALAAAPLLGSDEVDFERELLPLLKKNCFECHAGLSAGGPRKPKGGLRLDGAGWIRTGGAGGPILVAGRPDQSPLYALIVLEDDDPDRMPAKGERLTPEEAELFRRWIAGGAGLDGWMGAAGPAGASVPKGPVALPARLRVFETLGKGLAPVAPELLATALGVEGHARPVLPGGPLLRVDYLSNEKRVDAAVVARLGALREHVAILDLSGTGLGDSVLAEIASMKNLVQLDLSQTRVADGGLAALGALPALRRLNLHSTGLGDSALEDIAAMKSLEDLYVWRTRVSEDALARLRKVRPMLRVHTGKGLPQVGPPPDTRRRRTRR